MSAPINMSTFRFRVRSEMSALARRARILVRWAGGGGGGRIVFRSAERCRVENNSNVKGSRETTNLAF